MTPKQQRMFLERKKRYIKTIVADLQHIAKTKHPRATSFNNIRTMVNELEVLHSDTGKMWPSAEKIFWLKYDIDRFLEETQLCTKAHLLQCKSGYKSYSERMKDCIINYMRDSEL
jgi:hypothetical protein